ncbi:efflux RND transporter periplasmic adaptor subunit [Aureliella helgolandensis]|uniref:Multidrug resistance protein MdtN n=1 Tax=Aureliella helgolandensis TaxID=2527968 RepID=A0A518G4J5_9BACT|nr:HlyD family efflux transporter periplasmic adaptor subunit [Aureliella helgolandensis]QDV23508.1 multidrug resistance protein MdtN [Aureliella helgolandensis]
MKHENLVPPQRVLVVSLTLWSVCLLAGDGLPHAVAQERRPGAEVTPEFEFSTTSTPANALPGDVASARSLADAAVGPSTGSWLRFKQCPVLVEQAVDIPALESGVVESLPIKLNQSVTSGAVVAQLDSELAQLELRLAKLQHAAAMNLAQDNSDVDFHLVALQETQEELSSYEKISTSVSDSEIRRKTMEVGKARLALLRTQQALSRAGLESEMKSAGVEAAQKRLERRRVESPIDGVVAAIHMHAGQWVQAGQPIVRVENMSQLIADALVPIGDVDLSTIVGSEVRACMTTPEGELQFKGRVTSFDHKVSGQGLVRIHSRIENVQKAGQWQVLPGMTIDLLVAQP